jgi:hypothetical protein
VQVVQTLPGEGRTVRAQRPDGPRLVQIVQTLRTVRAQKPDGPRLVQIAQSCWLCYLPYLQGAAQVLFDFLFFVAVCFSSTAFGLHFFCDGGYSGCVSLNIFSASFSWLSFTLRRCNFLFWDRVNPAGHHRDMEYFGSAVLMVVVSFLVVLADSPKIIGPLLSPCMTTSAVPILMMSFFVVL